MSLLPEEGQRHLQHGGQKDTHAECKVEGSCVFLRTHYCIQAVPKATPPSLAWHGMLCVSEPLSAHTHTHRLQTPCPDTLSSLMEDEVWYGLNVGECQVIMTELPCLTTLLPGDTQRDT